MTRLFSGIYISLFLAAFVTHGCKSGTEEQGTLPVVTFVSPAAGQVWYESDTIPIRIGIESVDELHEFSVTIVNLANNKEAFQYHGHAHGRKVDLDLLYIPDIDTNAVMRLGVTTLDHNGNHLTRYQDFRVRNNISGFRPEVTILSPNQGEYRNGNVVRIQGRISHSDYLKEVTLFLNRDGTMVFELSPEVTGLKQYVFDTSITVNSASHANYLLHVAAKDKHDQVGMETVYFDVHP